MVTFKPDEGFMNCRAALIVFALVGLIICSGCNGRSRAEPEKAGTYSHAVIRKDLNSDYEGRTAAAVAPYFETVTWSEARQRGIGDHTIIVEWTASRGFWGSFAHVVFFDYTTKAQIGAISSHRGFLFSGMGSALESLFERADAEFAYWSARRPAAVKAP